MIVLALLWGCATCEVDAPLDHTADGSWLCKPGLDGACPATREVVSVATDGSTSSRTLEPVQAPDVACFAVYPTLDLRLGVALHDNLEDLQGPSQWARDQIAPFAEVCDLWVPVYRQVTIGTYVGKRTERKDACHTAAFADVLSAFDAFLAAEPDRPFALVGHSQGGQRISELLRARVESDPAVRARMVAAYPIGWAVAEDSTLQTEVCREPDQTGCMVSFRSVVEDGELEGGGPYAEGDTLVCVDPASPGDPGATAVMKAFTMSADSTVLDRRPPGVDAGALIQWPDAFEATCRADGSRALEVRWIRPDQPPVDLDGLDVTLLNGAHIIDMNLGSADLADDLRRRTDAWLAQ